MYVYGFYEINYGNATIYVCTRMYVMFTHLPTQMLQREMYVCMYVCDIVRLWFYLIKYYKALFMFSNVTAMMYFLLVSLKSPIISK